MPIPVSSNETSDRRSPVIVNMKTRHPPSLIPAELYRQPYFMSHNIPSYIPKTYSGPSSSDSRFSDQSDDSKYSPASSPNLLWKNRPLSPVIGQYKNRFEYIPQAKTDLSENEIKLLHRNAILEQQCRTMRLRVSPESCVREKRNTNNGFNTNRDVYTGANMLVNLRDRNPNNSLSSDCYNRKRHSDDSTERCSPKRIYKFSNETKKANNFNISYLLGLEDNKKLDVEYAHDQDVDVCELGDEDKKTHSYNDIFHKMSTSLEKTFHKTMPTVINSQREGRRV